MAALSCLVAGVMMLVLPGCGGSEGGGCATNPAGPGCVASASPPPQLVTNIVSQGNGPLGADTVAPVVFATAATGSLSATVDWTFASNDVDIYLTRGSHPCTLETFNNRTCGFIATAENVLTKPERFTVAGLAAGTYTLYVANFGDTDESVAYQVTLTSTSASSASSATSPTVTGSAMKGTLRRIAQPR